MYRIMEDWTDIRERVASGKVSKRAILRETGMHWKTLKKILTHSEPPGYRLRKARPQQKLGPYQERIEQILKEDQLLPRKQRHTAKRIWERLKEAGFTGGYTVVKEAVRELTQRNQEVFVPLVHPPGEAQMDFGHALVKLNGVLRKVAFFVMALPYSDAVFVQGPVGNLLPMNPSRDLPPDNPDVRPTASSPITHFRPPSLFRTDFSPAYAASEPLFHPICGCEAERSASFRLRFSLVSLIYGFVSKCFRLRFGFVSASNHKCPSTCGFVFGFNFPSTRFSVPFNR